MRVALASAFGHSGQGNVRACASLSRTTEGAGIDRRLERVLVEDVLGGIGGQMAVAEVDVDAQRIPVDHVETTASAHRLRDHRLHLVPREGVGRVVEVGGVGTEGDREDPRLVEGAEHDAVVDPARTAVTEPIRGLGR
jgi:hypothetical protein